MTMVERYFDTCSRCFIPLAARKARGRSLQLRKQRPHKYPAYGMVAFGTPFVCHTATRERESDDAARCIIRQILLVTSSFSL